jgi:hypothetical protein
MVYDHAISLDLEIEYIWKLKYVYSARAVANLWTNGTSFLGPRGGCLNICS